MTVFRVQLTRKLSMPSVVQQSALVPDASGLLQGPAAVAFCLVVADEGIATAAIGEAVHDGRSRSKPAAMIQRGRCMTKEISMNGAGKKKRNLVLMRCYRDIGLECNV